MQRQTEEKDRKQNTGKVVHRNRRDRKEEKERRKKSTELRCASTNKVKMEAQDLTEREQRKQ